MKQNPTGIIRNIDSYGKITIPKDFRSRLDIQEQDPVEISLDNDAIIIRKYQRIRKFQDLCEDVLNTFGTVSDAVCAITGTEHVLMSKGISLPLEQLLSEPVRNLILQAESYVFTEEEPLYLFEPMRYRVEALFPIGTAEHPVGAFILLHYRRLSMQTLEGAKLLATYLTLKIIDKQI